MLMKGLFYSPELMDPGVKRIPMQGYYYNSMYIIHQPNANTKKLHVIIIVAINSLIATIVNQSIIVVYFSFRISTV